MTASLMSLEDKPVRGTAVQQACARIAPLWPLKSFVAVNPFLGLSAMKFEDAGRLLDRVADGGVLMGPGYYLGKLREGAIEPEDLRAVGVSREWLEDGLREEEHAARILSVAEWLDERRGTQSAAFVVDEVSKWCASYFDEGQSTWAMPWRGLPLYRAWKMAAEVDANPEAWGVPAFRQFVWDMPDSADEAVEHALRAMRVPETMAVDLLHRQLLSVAGWSAYAAYQDRQQGGGDVVRQVLAVRLAYDAALLALAPEWQCAASRSRRPAGFSEARYAAHLALEYAYRRRLVRQLQGTSRPAGSAATRNALQAVFCIDVRSEVYRRALEAQSGQIATAGFAGFFGMSLEVGGTARCPVLLKPGYTVSADSSTAQWAKALAGVWKQLTSSASACFPSVEVGGAWFGLGMLRRFGLGASSKPEPAESLSWQIPLAERVALAAGALKNMSLEASALAPVVLLCGHGSTSANNPYAASLDCGACGGHKGDVNARFAAALFNDTAVRKGLAARGVRIPADTVFVAGLHNTTTDEVTLFDADVLQSRQRVQVEGWLRGASQLARKERTGAGEQEALRRGADWSEVRPEWGLAGNAAFIAAPRWRTQHLNLGGRAFLHEYDARADRDGSVLTLILTAPVIVASWINLQYFGSTVNNQLFGSGNKVLHNVVGKFGVWEGNGGDLRTGLPMQSLHDGERWMHEPLRLQVIVDAPRARVDLVLQGNADIRNLVENGWISLLAMDGDAVYVCEGVGRWCSS